jgi:RimJ/RimL family protein N-acetyltransferase
MQSLYRSAELPSPPWQTDRLVLRPYVESDTEVAHAALDRDEEIWRYDPGFAPTLEQRRAHIARFAILRRQFGFGPCAAFLRDEAALGGEGPLVGQGGLNPYIYDQRDGSRTVEFEVMYKLAMPYWGQGYATEIARFWVHFAFEYVRLPRLLICPRKANTRSVAVVARLGATFKDDWLDKSYIIGRIDRSRAQSVS